MSGKLSLITTLFISQLALADEITLLHFTDYHSHALPFLSEDRSGQGGVAHAIAYLEREKKKGALVFSGGDMINKGSPAWSDKFGCAEWPWFNGVVDAMAYGNHDSDYGSEAFARCRSLITYPILGANVLDADGKRIFDNAGKPYLVLERNGRRLGVFATAGNDYEKLIGAALRPVAGATFSDRTEATRAVVRALREEEKVDAVILIGHAHREDDEALARAVPGIDIIFGTHSHIKTQLHQIAGTQTWFISPYQYLTYISRVNLRFDGRELAAIEGGLVPVDRSIPAAPEIEAKVAAMQRELASDPAYAAAFRVLGRSPKALSIADQNFSQISVAGFVLEVVRKAAGADLAISTTSSFRRGVPEGDVTYEDLRATLPYPNKVLVYELSGNDARALLKLGAAKRGSDAFAQFAGRTSFRSDRTYKVATTDYLARVAPGYREFLATKKVIETPHEVRDLVRQYIEREW